MRTDARGHYSFVGLAPGQYSVTAELAPPDAPLFTRSDAVTLDGCSAESDIPVAAKQMTGVVRHKDGTRVGDQVPLRAIRVEGNARALTLKDSTLAFTTKDGTWALSGLPPGRYVVGVNALVAPSAQGPFATTWYPNASRLEQAQVVEVTNARTTRVDIVVPPQ